MSTASRWLNWTPGQPQIIDASRKIEPAKPSKLSFVGSEGVVSGDKQIIRESQLTPDRAARCPYALPEGVRLVRYTPKNPPIAVTVCSVVTAPYKVHPHRPGRTERAASSPRSDQGW